MEDKKKKSLYLPNSLDNALEQAAAYLELNKSEAALEIIRRGLVVGCPIRPKGTRGIMGLDVNENTRITTIYETPEIGEGIDMFRKKFRVRSYSATIRVLFCAGLYAYTPEMEGNNDE